MYIVPPKRTPRVMGVVLGQTRISLAVIDPWEVRVIREIGNRSTSPGFALRRIVLQERPVVIAAAEKTARSLRRLLRKRAPEIAAVRLVETKGALGSSREALATHYPEVASLPQALARPMIYRALALAVVALNEITPNQSRHVRKWREKSK